MLTALDIPPHYLRSLVCVGVVGLITSVERGAAVFDVNWDVHGTVAADAVQVNSACVSRPLGSGRARTQISTVSGFAEMLCVELDLNGLGALLCG